jgi:D-arabinose 5-phosphate isomerase GutQ
MAAKGVTDNLNPNKLREFVKAIDECQGQILISGIGECTNFLVLTGGWALLYA